MRVALIFWLSLRFKAGCGEVCASWEVWPFATFFILLSCRDTTIKIRDNFIDIPKKLNDMIVNGLSDSNESKFLKFIFNKQDNLNSPKEAEKDLNSLLDKKPEDNPFLNSLWQKPEKYNPFLNALLQKPEKESPFLMGDLSPSTDAILNKNK